MSDDGKTRAERAAEARVAAAKADREAEREHLRERAELREQEALAAAKAEVEAKRLHREQLREEAWAVCARDQLAAAGVDEAMAAFVMETALGMISEKRDYSNAMAVVLECIARCRTKD